MQLVKQMIKDFYPFAKKQLGFNKPVQVQFAVNHENAKNPLARTAHYSPDNFTITLYTTGRHPKDILRSFAHELVHHAQCCRGEFANGFSTGQGYAQKDDRMREMEREAYERGNLCFRDWEDSLKENNNNKFMVAMEQKKGVKTMNQEVIKKAIYEAVKEVLEKRSLVTEKELSAAQKEKMDVEPDNPPEGPGPEDGDGDINKKDLKKLREEETETEKKEREESEEHFGKELANPKRDDKKLEEEEIESTMLTTDQAWWNDSLFESLKKKWIK